MTYWAHPLMSNKVSKQQARALRQAIEIFISQDESLYPELYQAYLVGKDKIDSKKASDLNKLFNISEKNLNNPEVKFSFIQVEDDGTLNDFDGTYNDFVKNNTTTFAGSTKLDDGEYGYVIQPIVRFDMNTTGESVVQEEMMETPSSSQVEKAASILNTTVDELIKTMEITGMSVEQILEAANTANRLEKNSNEFDC